MLKARCPLYSRMTDAVTALEYSRDAGNAHEVGNRAHSLKAYMAICDDCDGATCGNREAIHASINKATDLVLAKWIGWWEGKKGEAPDPIKKFLEGSRAWAGASRATQ
jgi:hypothetical protein